MIHFDMPPQKSNIIKVLGFGGGGSNAVNHMFRQNSHDVDFIICNTDAQSLAQSPVPNKVQLGPHLTQGLGAGANPSIGRQATEESLEELRRMLEVNTRMAFITAGMGGGTGTGGAPTVAKICKELGILTVGIVTTPFSWEGPKRMAQAQEGINLLKEHVDTLLVISNDKLRHQYGNLKMKQAFEKADDVLTTAARCITDVIYSTGQINVDFADVCTVMRDGGVAILGSATARGDNRALMAIESAINSPLLNDNDIRGAKWILLNITSSEGDHEFTMDEVEEIQNYVRQLTGENTDVILGMGYDSDLGDQLGITLIATGFAHKDPFAKPVVKKAESKPEPVIVMELGKQGEELKMYGQKPAAPEVKPADAMQPVLEEETAPPVIYQAPVEEPVSNTPVFMTLGEEEKKPEVEADGPLTFELSLNTPEVINTNVMQDNADVTDDYNVIMNRSAAEKAEQTERQVYAHGFLNKPANVYTPSQQPAQPQQPVQQPPMQPFIQQPPVVKQEEEPVMKLVEIPVEKVPEPKMEIYDEEAAALNFSLTTQDDVIPEPKVQGNLFNEPQHHDLSEEEEQKRRAQERIERLRKLSFNFNNSDSNSSEFDNVPAYMRKNMELHNTIANVEEFYSRAQVKTDEHGNTNISTLNNFLHGKQPD